ncbi:MAG: ABC transporter permease [Firmicutes bacterium]|jgi:ABC-2 type transport system permease protein|nr:ABC transporter permease [Bacillota bacterium]
MNGSMISPRAVGALYRSSVKEYLRNPVVVGFTAIMPLVLAVFLSLVMGNTEGLTPRHYFPNMLGVSMMWLGMFATAQPLVEQREQKIFRRMWATPLSRTSVLLSQLLFRMTIGVAQGLLFIIVGWVGFGVAVVGNWFLVIAATILGTLVFVSLGYVLAGVARTQEAAPAVAQPLQMAMLFLSGTLLPAAILPGAVQPVLKIVPLTYVADALRQVISGLPPMFPLWADFAVMAGWLVLFFVLAVRLFRWE